MSESGTPSPQAQASAIAQVDLFQYGRRRCSFADFLAWAELVGRLESLVTHLRRTQRAVDSGMQVRQEHLQQAADEFRYRNHLLTVNETEAWLAERALARDDLHHYLLRGFCHDPVDMAMSIDEWCDAVDDVYGELWAALHFSGNFDALLEEYLFRVAAQALVPRGAGRKRSLSVDASPLTRILLEGRLDEARRLEGSYRVYAEDVAGRESCERRLKSQRLQLRRLHYQALSYANQDQAQEAWSCLQHDEESPDQLAERTGVLLRTGKAFAEDLPPDVARVLQSTQPGETTDPLKLPGTENYTVFRLVQKTEPKLNSSGVRRRLRRLLVAEKLSPEIERNLSWLPWAQEG